MKEDWKPNYISYSSSLYPSSSKNPDPATFTPNISITNRLIVPKSIKKSSSINFGIKNRSINLGERNSSVNLGEKGIIRRTLSLAKFKKYLSFFPVN